MEVWVAGATGVLGRHIVPQLLAAGHTVVGLARDLSKWPDAPSAMRFVPCDITVSGQVIQAFGTGKPDAVLHLATAIPPGRPSAKDWERNDAVRRAGTRNLTDAALLAEAYYIQQSVHFVYAPQGDRWIAEDAPFGKLPVITSAIEAEKITQHTFQQGLPGAIIRPATLYSADSSQTKALVHGIRSGMPVLIGNGQNYWSFIHPHDVGTAILRLLELQPAHETYNLSDDEPMTMRDCLQFVAGQLHTHPPKSIAPFLAKVAVGAETVELLTGSRRIANTKAERELGWRPHYKTFRDGFEAMLPHLRA